MKWSNFGNWSLPSTIFQPKMILQKGGKCDLPSSIFTNVFIVTSRQIMRHKFLFFLLQIYLFLRFLGCRLIYVKFIPCIWIRNVKKLFSNKFDWNKRYIHLSFFEIHPRKFKSLEKNRKQHVTSPNPITTFK